VAFVVVVAVVGFENRLDVVNRPPVAGAGVPKSPPPGAGAGAPNREVVPVAGDGAVVGVPKRLLPVVPPNVPPRVKDVLLAPGVDPALLALAPNREVVAVDGVVGVVGVEVAPPNENPPPGVAGAGAGALAP